MIIIPIGIQCLGATFKNEIKKTHTLPFDWILSNPLFVFKILELLLENNMNIEELVKNHFLNCKKRASVHNFEHYYTIDNGVALYNTEYNVMFPHDTYDDTTIDKYIRRFERLKNIILNSTEKLYFIYISQSSLENGNYTIDNNIIIKDVYINISKIYNLINKFNTNFKIIIFDAIQEENLELLDKNIILYKLNKCNYWEELLPQMREYKNIFIETNI